MARIKIISASEVQSLPIEQPGVGKAVIPIDGQFHPIDSRLIPMLRDCAVVFELEEDAEEPDSEEGTEAGGDDGLGGSASPPIPVEELEQLDRDGNGEAGGSLPGNETVPAAKGKRTKRKG